MYTLYRYCLIIAGQRYVTEGLNSRGKQEGKTREFEGDNKIEKSDYYLDKFGELKYRKVIATFELDYSGNIEKAKWVGDKPNISKSLGEELLKQGL